MSETNTVTLMLVRHGETDMNRQVRVQGKLDAPLNEVGVAQAKAAAERLSKEPISLIVSSPLVRAQKTATFILDAQVQDPKPQLVADPRLAEISFGTLEGACVAPDTPTGKVFKEIFHKWEAGEKDVGPEGGETPREVENRAIPAIFEAMERAKSLPNKTVLIVAHGRLLRIVLSCLLGLPIVEVQLGNTALCQVEWNGFGKDPKAFKTVLMNSTDHVKDLPLLPTFNHIMGSPEPK